MSWSLNSAQDSVPAVLIAAQSGRALAAAARRAGYAPLVADLFEDDDTSALAARTARLPGNLGRAPGRAALLRTLERLSEGAWPIGLAYGSGFETRPELIDAAAERFPLLGNSGGTVKRLKDPRAFAALCHACAVPHPEIGSQPGTGEWLEKRAGGSGGTHVGPAKPGRVRPPRYVQRRAEGRPVSALFLADGRGRSLVLGFSSQWAAPAPGEPHRYGGTVRPAQLDGSVAAEIEAAVHRLAAAAGLVGLNSADCLVRADGFDVLEINPRPGASLDVFEQCRVASPSWPGLTRPSTGCPRHLGDDWSETDRVDRRVKPGHDSLRSTHEHELFQLHVKACRDGQLPAQLPGFEGAAASAVAYARRAVSVRVGFTWPHWAADRQRPNRPVAERGPLCTILAKAGNVEAARALAMTRVETILAMVEGT